MQAVQNKAVPKSKFGLFVRDNNINLSALSRESGVNYMRLQAFRLKGLPPHYDEAVKVARVLQRPVEELFDFPNGL